MKNLIKFLEENSKWLVRIFIWIGFFLILRLWWFGMNSVCSGSGFISLCIIPEYTYYWNNAGYIAVIFLFISSYLIYLIKNEDNKFKKVKIALLILILGILGKPLFLFVSPDFRFYLTPASWYYKDSNGKIDNLDKYLELTTKYCDNFKELDDFHFKYSRETMCSGKFETDFETVEEYIEILEYAKNHNFRYLYQNTFRWIDENVGLENVIEKYNDDTFYAYNIYRGELTLNQRKILEEKITNISIGNLLEFYNESIIENNKLILNDKYHNISLFWEKFDYEIRNKIKQIPEVNYKIF